MFKFLTPKEIKRHNIEEKDLVRRKDGTPSLYHFYKKFIWDYKWYMLVFVIGIQLYQGIATFISPYFVKEIINIISVSGKEAALDASMPWIIAGFIIITLSTIIYYYADKVVFSNVFPFLTKNIRASSFNFVGKNSYRFFSENSSGQIANKISSISNLSQILLNVVWWVLVSILTFSINLVIFFSISPILAGLLVLYAVIIFFIIKPFYKKIKKSSAKVETNSSKTSGVIVDCLSNFLNLKLFASNKKEEKYVLNKENKLKKVTQDLNYNESDAFGIVKLLDGIFFSLFVGLSIYLYTQDKILLGDMSYVLIMQSMILNSISVLFLNFRDLVNNWTQNQSALNLVFTPIEIEDKKNAKDLKLNKGEIEFENVCFKYNKEWILNDFNLTIKAGEKVGLVGHSGAGKTTLVNLILRFFEAQKGSIKIDGQKIVDVKQNSLRSNISVIPQEAVMFNRTIEENIKYGNEDASKKEIEKAAKKSEAYEFIKNSKKGWQTIVGERGIKLSGGQRQRIAIARAMLKKAKIILMDEPTSALDSKTEQVIQKSFNELMENKTAIIVAHRLSTLKHLDKIIVMDKGKIVQQGTHNQLIRKNGIYKELWEKQVNGFITE